MANPAQLLHSRFSSWRGPQTAAASTVRGLNGQNWDEHALAIRHLGEIEELLRLLESQGRNMRVARQALPGWYQVVFAFPNGWNGQGSALISQQSIDTLEMLAERLEDVVPTLQTDGLDRIRGYLDSVSDALTNDASLPSALRGHINDVIAHVRWCVDNYSITGDFSLQDALERLSGAVVRGAANSAQSSRWKDVMTNFVWPFTVSVMASALPAQQIIELVAS